jgi:hypothetical protein
LGVVVPTPPGCEELSVAIQSREIPVVIPLVPSRDCSFDHKRGKGGAVGDVKFWEVTQRTIVLLEVLAFVMLRVELNSSASKEPGELLSPEKLVMVTPLAEMVGHVTGPGSAPVAHWVTVPPAIWKVRFMAALANGVSANKPKTTTTQIDFFIACRASSLV